MEALRGGGGGGSGGGGGFSRERGWGALNKGEEGGTKNNSIGQGKSNGNNFLG